MKADVVLGGAEGPVLTGIGGTERMAIGTAGELSSTLGPEDLVAALKTSREQVRHLIAALPAQEGENFSAHLNFLEDPTFTREPLETMEKTGCDAAEAIRRASEELQATFQEFDDPYMRERAADIRDVGERILRNL